MSTGNDSRETSRPEYFPEEVIEEEFAQWWSERDTDAIDGRSTVREAFAAGMNAGYEIAVDQEKG